MGASFLLAVLIAQASPAQPTTTSTPPPTIVNVQSKNGVCVSLKDSISPSIGALLQNDHTIVDGMYQLNLLAGDGGTLRSKMDLLHLENDVSNIVRNLSAIDNLLQNTGTAETPPADAQTIETMKKSLRDVARGQLMTLNVLDGVLESNQMAEFADISNLPNFSVVNQEGFGASLSDAVDRSSKEAVTAPRLWSRALARDFFPALKRSEVAASAAVIAGAGQLVRPVKRRLTGYRNCYNLIGGYNSDSRPPRKRPPMFHDPFRPSPLVSDIADVRRRMPVKRADDALSLGAFESHLPNLRVQ